MHKLQGKIDGELITREFFPDDVGCEKYINMGECYVWAYIAYMLYENVELWTNEAHAFPCQDGLFFDSEVPEGVNRWQSLPTNRWNTHMDTYPVEAEEFAEYWRENGVRGKERMNVSEIEKRILLFLLRQERKQRGE